MAELKSNTTIGGYRQLHEGIINPTLPSKLTITQVGPANQWTYSGIGDQNVSLELGKRDGTGPGSLRINAYNANQFQFIRVSNGNFHVDSTTGEYYFNNDTSSNGGANGILYICNQQGNTGIKLDSQGTSTFAGGLSVSGTISEGGTALSSKYLGISQTAQQATKLQTQRTIQLSGAVTGSATFDGSQNITISTSTNHNHDDRYLQLSGGTLTGTLTVTGQTTLNNTLTVSGETTLNNTTVYGSGWYPLVIRSTTYNSTQNAGAGIAILPNDDISKRVEYSTKFDGGFRIWQQTYDGNVIYSKPDGTIIINNSLGIGTTNPLYKLDVNGEIRGTKVWGAVYNDYQEYRI